jgi:hypothetical protein
MQLLSNKTEIKQIVLRLIVEQWIFRRMMTYLMSSFRCDTDIGEGT